MQPQFVTGVICFVGNGYSRSEAIVAVYLQKAPNAKRIYASIIHSKNNSDGYKEQGKLLNLMV